MSRILDDLRQFLKDSCMLSTWIFLYMKILLLKIMEKQNIKIQKLHTETAVPPPYHNKIPHMYKTYNIYKYVCVYIMICCMLLQCLYSITHVVTLVTNYSRKKWIMYDVGYPANLKDL